MVKFKTCLFHYSNFTFLRMKNINQLSRNSNFLNRDAGVTEALGGAVWK
jgi:hypothetical protein